MKILNGFKYMMVILCVVACSQVASAQIVLLNDHELEAVRGQAGIVSMGIGSLGNRAMLAANSLERNQALAVQKNTQQVDLGVFQDDALLTLEGVDVTASINTGSSFSEVVEKDGNAAIHCHFENYELTIDRLKVDAVYAGGLTSGASFGAFEMTGFSMVMSGDVTLGMHR